MDCAKAIDVIDKILKGIYNLGYEEFKGILSQEVKFIDDNAYEEHFRHMRTDLFGWWCAISANVKTAFVNAVADD